LICFLTMHETSSFVLTSTWSDYLYKNKASMWWNKVIFSKRRKNSGKKSYKRCKINWVLKEQGVSVSLYQS
jgi:hypothetical protein